MMPRACPSTWRVAKLTGSCCHERRVGSCSGKVPWQIFQQFKPRSVVGVDIDQEMIRLANEKLFFAGKKEGEDYSDRLDFR